MTGAEPLQRRDFDQLVAEHQQLIRLANELEFQLYQMGDAPGPEQVAECRQAAGDLIRLLRHVLFRHDQQVLPLLEDQTK
jgi:hypothetical protein